MNGPDARIHRFRSYLPDPSPSSTLGLVARTVAGRRRRSWRLVMPAVALAGILVVAGLMTVRALRTSAPAGPGITTSTTDPQPAPTWGTILHLYPDTVTLPADDATVAKVAASLRRQIDESGIAEPSITITGDHIDIRLPGVAVAEALAVVPPSQIIDGTKAMEYAPPEPYGRNPHVSVAHMPGALQAYLASSFPNAVSTAKVVLRTDAAHRGYVVWSFNPLQGEKVVTRPGPTSVDVFVDRSTTWDTGSCFAPGPASPVVECTGAGRRTASEITFIGRVDPSVVRVEGRYASGRPVAAAVDNGWFMFVGDPRRGDPTKLQGVDRLGRDVGVGVAPLANLG